METQRVLLVDDDVDFLEVNRIALEGAGFAVVTAENGAQALQLAAETPLDAAVLDVMMTTPEEGFELARALRKHPKTRRLPLLMLTSVNAVNAAQGWMFRFSDQDRDEMWLPVDKFLDKPVKSEQLVAHLRSLVG
jgi:CheY-like chemotaxis protein